MSRTRQVAVDNLNRWIPWNSGERPLYEARFQAYQQSGAYETNFAFLQQECRERAWMFADQDLIVTACARGAASEFVFVLPPVGSIEHALKRLPALCEDLAVETGQRIILRKLSPALFAGLRENRAFVPVPLTTYRNPRELPEDIYPQVICPTRRTDDFAGTAFMRVRNNMRVAQRDHEIAFANFGPNNQTQVQAMIRAWARDYSVRAQLSDARGKAPVSEAGVDPTAYTVFCERMSDLVDDRLYFGRVMTIDSEVAGLTFAGRTAQDTAGLYVSLCGPRIRGASDCMIADILDRLAAFGVVLLNFGGSEGEDLFKYKSKWRPSMTVQTHELEYIARSRNG